MSPRVGNLVEEAVRRARAAGARAHPRWAALAQANDEVEALVRDALEHLDAGRWDEGQACAEEAQRAAEHAGHGAVWREFGLLVEEAAEIGFAAGSLDGG